MKEAIDYINEGLNPIPIPLKQKAPNIPNWQKLKVNNSNVEQYFNGQPSNIGVVLGKNIVDVDIDSNFVKPFCDILLPNTGKIFGRQSNPRSHYLFKSSGTSKKFEIRNNTLIEIRTGDQQTVFPPSIHTSGEKISWEKNTSYGEIDFTDLHQKVGLIAFLGFVLSQYPSSAGTRDELCLCISSILIKNQINQDTASEIVQKLAQLGGDEEWSSRDKTRGVINRLELNKPVYGLKKLSEILGLNDQEKDKLHSWLTINQDDQKTHPLVITSHLEGLQTIIPKPDWLVDRLIMKKTVFMISGFGGSGKSTLVLNLAVYGAYSKKEFLKRNIPTPFSTLIINQEDTKNIMYLKIKGIINHNKIDIPYKSEELFKKENDKNSPRIDLLSGAEHKIILGKFHQDTCQPTPYYHQIKNEIKTRKYDLIVFDPFILLFEGLNENDATHVSVAMKLISEIANECNCAIIIVDHTSKNSLNYDLETDFNSRQSSTKGSINKMSSARGGLLVSHMSKSQAKSFHVDEKDIFDYINVVDSKNNYAKITVEGTWLKKTSIQVDHQECLVLSENHDLAQRYASGHSTHLELLQNNIKYCSKIILKQFGDSDTCTLNKIVQSVMQEEPFIKVSQTTTRDQIIRALANDGVVHDGIRLRYFQDDSKSTGKHLVIKEKVENEGF